MVLVLAVPEPLRDSSLVRHIRVRQRTRRRTKNVKRTHSLLKNKLHFCSTHHIFNSDHLQLHKTAFQLLNKIKIKNISTSAFSFFCSNDKDINRNYQAVSKGTMKQASSWFYGLHEVDLGLQCLLECPKSRANYDSPAKKECYAARKSAMDGALHDDKLSSLNKENPTTTSYNLFLEILARQYKGRP